MFSREEDKIDIIINFVILGVIWTLVSLFIAFYIGKEKTFKERFLYSGLGVFVILFICGYFHFKNTNFRMDLVHHMFIFYFNKILIIGQFLIVFRFFLKNQSKGLTFLFIASTTYLITNLVYFIFDTRGLSVAGATKTLWKILDYVTLCANAMLLLGIYFLIKQNLFKNKAIK